MIAAVV